MAEKTGIEWADATWNPWWGCHKVSTGCKNCYMFRDMHRFGKDPDVVRRTSNATFRSPLKWANRNMVRANGRIFTCSFSDWFIEEADEWRDEAWKIIKDTPAFRYLILTKRPQRIINHLPADWGMGYPNVWLLVSVENQAEYNVRWPILAELPATIRGISAEPLLGPIFLHGLEPDWVISGGESDKSKPRHTDPAWTGDLRDQCTVRGIPFFHKQNGGSVKVKGAWGGRELDGRTHNEFPEDSPHA